MKKGLVVGIGVLALMALMVWADRKFPAQRPGGSTPAAASAAASLASLPIKDLNDNSVNLAQYKGKVVLVNFWATWCAPCKAEIPLLIDLQNKYGPQGFTILGISMDDDGKKAVQPFLESQRFNVNGQQDPINYPILIGNDNIAQQFGADIGLPTSILFSRDGRKTLTIVGGINVDEAKNLKAIQDLL